MIMQLGESIVLGALSTLIATVVLLIILSSILICREFLNRFPILSDITAWLPARFSFLALLV